MDRDVGRYYDKYGLGLLNIDLGKSKRNPKITFLLQLNLVETTYQAKPGVVFIAPNKIPAVVGCMDPDPTATERRHELIKCSIKLTWFRGDN